MIESIVYTLCALYVLFAIYFLIYKRIKIEKIYIETLASLTTLNELDEMDDDDFKYFIIYTVKEHMNIKEWTIVTNPLHSDSILGSRNYQKKIRDLLGEKLSNAS